MHLPLFTIMRSIFFIPAFWLCLMFIWTPFPIDAQKLNFRNFTMQDGLSQMKITSLHLDSRGFLWIGTRNGLNKFDGENFTAYSELDGLSHNRIHDISESQNGHLVILTYNGVDVFDGSSFISFPKSFQNVHYDFEAGSDGEVWVCDKDIEKTLWRLSEGEYKVIYNANEDNSRNISFQFDKQKGQAYLSNQDSLFLVENGSLISISTARYYTPMSVGDYGDKPFFVRVTNDKGDVRYMENKVDIPVAGFIENDNGLLKDISPNSLWYFNRGVLDIASAFGQRKIISDQFSLVVDVAGDAHKQFWIGTENGLAQIYSDAFTTYKYNDLPYIWTCLEDMYSKMWFGSYGQGLFRMDKEGGIELMTEGYYFAASAMDRQGRLYFGRDQGLEVWHNAEPSIVWNQTVFNMQLDSLRNKLVFGTFGGIGILNDQLEIKYFGQAEGIHNNGYIQSIGIDEAGQYWAGSYSGISRFNPENDTIKNYTLENGKLPSKGVFCQFLDANGTYWLGGDNGLMYFDASRDSIVPIISDVLQDRVKSIIDLDEDRLLLGTKDGLLVFHSTRFLEKNEIVFQPLNSSNGYQGIDPGFTGMFKDSEGHIWICSATTVDKMDPNKIPKEVSLLDARISFINEIPIPFDHSAYTFENPFKRDNLIIDFEAIGFQRPAITKYQFRINESEWSPWQTESQAILTDLSSGNYSFEVRAGPTDLSPEFSANDQVQFTISLPFYLENWFPGSALALGIMLLGLVAYYFIRQRMERRRYQGQLAEARYLRSQLLLAELNPHFIFNVLSAIQNKVLFEEKEVASKYVVRLSKLMRNFLNASYQGNLLDSGNPEYEISLSKEIELLQSFAEFEQIKNDQHFDFHLDLQQGMQTEQYMLPPMLIQPFVENAIKHGLLLNEEKGNLWLRFRAENGSLKCIIEDDGVGMKESKEIRKHSFSEHKSLGSKIVQERIDLLNNMGYDIQIDTLERNPQGTIVEITLSDIE